MDMRRYLWLGTLLYGANAFFLLVQPEGFRYAVINQTVLVGDHLAYLYGIMFVVVAGIKLIAGIRLTPYWQVFAVASGSAMATIWTLITLWDAIFFHGYAIVPMLWSYIAIITFAVLPYAMISGKDKQRLEEKRRRLEHKAERVHGTHEVEEDDDEGTQ